MTTEYWRDKKLRTGRSVHRTIYLVNPSSDDRKNDHLIGLMDTPELAEQVATRWNAATAERRTARSTEMSARGLAALDNAELAHLVLTLLDRAISNAGAGADLNTMIHLSVEVQ